MVIGPLQLKLVPETLTEKEFVVSTFWHLDSRHCPRIKDLRLHNRNLAEELVLVSRTFPALVVFYFSFKLFFSPKSWNIVYFFLKIELSYWLDLRNL